MAAKPIAIDTQTLARHIGDAVNIKVGGKVYEARCPKDAVLLKLRDGEADTIEVIMRAFRGMIGSENAVEVETMLNDPDNREVCIDTLARMIAFLIDDPAGPKWGDALQSSVKELGSGETPRTVATRKAAPRTAKRAAGRR